jgi:hypothetical protein
LTAAAFSTLTIRPITLRSARIFARPAWFDARIKNKIASKPQFPRWLQHLPVHQTKALLSAGATEKIISDAQLMLDACIKIGRPRVYANRNEQQRAYRARRKEREKALAASQQIDGDRVDRPMVPSLKGLLVNAANWNVDREASVEPIRHLIDMGCDLEADILPIVAREVPELPRPLKNWGAPWLVREILAARDQRLAG